MSADPELGQRPLDALRSGDIAGAVQAATRAYRFGDDLTVTKAQLLAAMEAIERVLDEIIAGRSVSNDDAKAAPIDDRDARKSALEELARLGQEFDAEPNAETWLQREVAPAYDAMKADLSRADGDDADYTPGPKTIAAMQEARRGGLEQITLAALQAEWTQGVESGDGGELDFEELKAGARKRRKAIEAVDLSDETAVVFDPEILGGELVVRGTRVPALDILARLRAGQTTAKIHRDYPSLELVDGIDGVIRWAEKTLGADWRATDKRVTQPNAETPSETAYRILEKHGLAFPANCEPIPPEEFRKLYGEGDETNEPKPD
jgi:uncharacterized protein (DUF433 family)